jgi:hypothetical protein
MTPFKKFLIVMLVMQVLLICCGVWQITQGKIGSGVFNIILNGVFGLLNIYNIKRIE